MESSTLIVDRLAGEESATAIQERAGEVHASYWRCPHVYPDSPGGKPARGACSGHRYARVDGGDVRVETTNTFSGAGTALWLTDSGEASASSVQDDGAYLIVDRRLPGEWSGLCIIGTAPLAPTHHIVDSGGLSRLAWIERCPVGNPVEQRDGVPCRVKSYSWTWIGGGSLDLDEPIGLQLDLTLAFDRAGGLHRVWISGRQTVGEPDAPPPAPPPGLLLYQPPGATPPVAAATIPPLDSARIAALAIDAQGHAHVLYTQQSALAQWPVPDVLYGTNSSGVWVTRTIASAFPESHYLPERLAIAVDAEGAAHVAIVAGVHPDRKVEATGRVLLAGDNVDGAWRFRALDDDAVGAVSIAVASGKRPVARIAYFGRDTFKIATVPVL